MAKMEISIEDAVNRLKEAVREDSDYAWSWQCNIAVFAADEGLTIAEANKAAARVMRNAFGVDMTKHENYEMTQEYKI